jgi:16S rRNA (cytidine1402-2'-O)-methyltransferase
VICYDNILNFLRNIALPGKLYIVSTPIGHLEDITLRALRILKEVDVIAAEDTRHTQKLLNSYQIHKKLTSYHDHNKEEKAPVLVQYLIDGQSVALVTDAGTPSISDPGYFLINRCIQADISIVPVPGASAFLAALSVSGLPTDSFVFEGFLPRKKTARIKRLETLKAEPRTILFFESPHRLIGCLTDILTVFGNRRVVLARELTKSHEEVVRNRLAKMLSELSNRTVRGEITLAVEGSRKISALW